MICPLPRYWMCHAVVALIIMAVFGFIAWFLPVQFAFAGACAGGGFYAGKEFSQWVDQSLMFDWKGLMAPIMACLVAYGLVTILSL